MDNKIIIVLWLIFFASACFAQDEFNIGEGSAIDTTVSDDTQLQQTQQLIQSLSNLSTKINEIEQLNTSNLEKVAELLIQTMNEKESNIIILTILISLACQGLWWAIFLYFQSRSLIIGINTKKQVQSTPIPPKLVEKPKPPEELLAKMKEMEKAMLVINEQKTKLSEELKKYG